MAQLLSSLPIGAKVKFGKHSINGETAQNIIWKIVAKNHISTPAYPTNSVTLLTNEIIDVRCLDGAEPGNPVGNRGSSGNNNYPLSNMHQWLNSAAAEGQWYAATHSYDYAPNAAYVSNSTQHTNRPGFLNPFSIAEQNAIMSTTLRAAKASADGGGYADFTAKVFIPSITEITGETEDYYAEGAQWEYFAKGSTPIATVTKQAATYSLAGLSTKAIEWWTRSATFDSPQGVRCIDNESGGKTYSTPTIGNIGVRPALNLSSTLLVSDTADADGTYTFVWNSAPNKPDLINTPATIYGGKSNPISWSAATDADGDAVTYQLECSINGGAYTQIYNGRALSYAHLVPLGVMVVSYRVKATDPSGESSDYTTSPTLMPVDNYPPEISGSDSNLGVKTDGFLGTYYISDANNDTVTVTEAIDGVRIRSIVATLGEVIEYGVTGDTWLALPNGSHTLTISATDGIDTTVRTYTFTKMVDWLEIQNERPWDSSTMPTRIMVVVTRNIPIGASFKVEVCNNGYDTFPTWEDATAAVQSGMVHVFSNKSKDSNNLWGVCVRVTVERNGATGACYVSAIGGNFE